MSGTASAALAARGRNRSPGRIRLGCRSRSSLATPHVHARAGRAALPFLPHRALQWSSESEAAKASAAPRPVDASFAGWPPAAAEPLRRLHLLRAMGPAPPLAQLHSLR